MWGNHWLGQVLAHVEAEVAMGGFSSRFRRAGGGTAVRWWQNWVSPYQLPDVGELRPPAQLLFDKWSPNSTFWAGGKWLPGGDRQVGPPLI